MPLQERASSMVLSTDASMSGWGAVLTSRKAKGRWSPLERENHINYLELLAVYRAIMIFRKELQNKVVSLQLDNVTAASYPVKEGGTRSQVFNRLARQILFTCRESSIHLEPAYLPGIANLGADALSRDKQSQEWALNPKVARTIFRIFGRPQVDLFASQRSALLPQYFSIDRKDKKALGIDALEQTWKFQLMYAFPPPQLIPMVLAKIRMTKATLILVAPFWTRASWLPELIQLSVEKPYRFPAVQSTVKDLTTGRDLPSLSKLRLTVWLILAELSKTKEWESPWQSLYVDHGENRQRSNTRAPGFHGVGGVTDEMFDQL